LVVSSLSWSELTKGLHVTTSLPVFKERLARLEALRRAFGDGLPYDDACVRRYDALLRRGVEQGGDARAHVLDRMIAATAVEHGTAVVTRDRSGFRGLEGLLVVDER
jgi:predicted nucleic acid-binding protein